MSQKTRDKVGWHLAKVKAIAEEWSPLLAAASQARQTEAETLASLLVGEATGEQYVEARKNAEARVAIVAAKLRIATLEGTFAKVSASQMSGPKKREAMGDADLAMMVYDRMADECTAMMTKVHEIITPGQRLFRSLAVANVDRARAAAASEAS